MKYRWKEGRRLPIQAQVVGDRIAKLRDSMGGHITPAAVVSDARPVNAPLHQAFEWEDGKAANSYREWQARCLLNSLVVVEVSQEDGKEQVRSVQAYVHVDLEDEGPAYVSTSRAFSEESLKEQTLQNALVALNSFKRRFEHLRELSEIFIAIERVERKVQRVKPRRRLVAQKT